MTSRMHRFALAFASLLMGLGQARAETPAETAAAFGLLGTWAVDCRLPPSVANGYLTYAATPGGNIAHDRDFGSQRNVGEVVRASLTARFSSASSSRPSAPVSRKPAVSTTA